MLVDFIFTLSWQFLLFNRYRTPNWMNQLPCIGNVFEKKRRRLRDRRHYTKISTYHPFQVFIIFALSIYLSEKHNIMRQKMVFFLHILCSINFTRTNLCILINIWFKYTIICIVISFKCFRWWFLFRFCIFFCSLVIIRNIMKIHKLHALWSNGQRDKRIWDFAV